MSTNLPTLEELAGWPWDEDDDLVCESDVHFDDEIRASDVIAEEEWENQRLEARADWLLFNRPWIGVS